MPDSRPAVIALMGPTASGKSALALALAQAHAGEIVSVDSVLVYRGLDIGSAKPSAAERARVAHHLLDVCAPHTPFSAAMFARAAGAAITDILARGKLPILVGGTGLYFQALFEGLAPMPESEPALRAALIRRVEAEGPAALHAELAQVDALAAARIDPGDTQRIVRALEVWRLSGVPISAWQARTRPTRPPWRLLKLVLAPQNRAVLHARIASRFEAMLAAGFLDEVRALRADPQWRADLPAMRAVGYRQACAHLAGEIDFATFRERAIAATRQLAKRQFTWLRGELDALWFDPAAQEVTLHAAVNRFLY